ncbi:hypothetical protein [Corynebacterium sp. MSK158]|nr:hypothetical protein [Corynebacterium sp. MSK158]MDK8693744.1 hypothetical protein [Corynebacterium sp. MSK158]
MDLFAVQMHLDNFVNAWEDRGKIVDGLKGIANVKEVFEDFTP